mgnify:CR=1 FL=1
MQIILGSQSPRRKDILHLLINNFSIKIPDIDESITTSELPEKFCNRIACEKNENILTQVSDEDKQSALIISSDTIVAIDNKILGKPKDYNEAVSMIQLLSNKKHSVISSIALTCHKKNKIKQNVDFETTYVYFKNLTKNIISDYLNKIKYDDKAGSYAIQEHGNMIIHKIEGSLSNVIGFPVRLFLKMCNDMGIVDNIWGLKKK